MTLGARSSLTLASILPCWHRGWFAACGLASAGVLRGEGLGADLPNQDQSFFVALGVRLGAEVPLGGTWQLRLYTEADTPLTPTVLRTKGTDIWTTPAVGVRLGVAPSVTF